jgi:hypothetical protein
MKKRLAIAGLAGPVAVLAAMAVGLPAKAGTAPQCRVLGSYDSPPVGSVPVPSQHVDTSHRLAYYASQGEIACSIKTLPGEHKYAVASPVAWRISAYTYVNGRLVERTVAEGRATIAAPPVSVPKPPSVNGVPAVSNPSVPTAPPGTPPTPNPAGAGTFIVRPGEDLFLRILPMCWQSGVDPVNLPPSSPVHQVDGHEVCETDGVFAVGV